MPKKLFIKLLLLRRLKDRRLNKTTEKIIPDDFTLELYKKDGTWVKQIMVDTSYNVIEDYIGQNPLDDNDEFYYSSSIGTHLPLQRMGS